MAVAAGARGPRCRTLPRRAAPRHAVLRVLHFDSRADPPVTPCNKVSGAEPREGKGHRSQPCRRSGSVPFAGRPVVLTPRVVGPVGPAAPCGVEWRGGSPSWSHITSRRCADKVTNVAALLSHTMVDLTVNPRTSTRNLAVPGRTEPHRSGPPGPGGKGRGEPLGPAAGDLRADTGPIGT